MTVLLRPVDVAQRMQVSPKTVKRLARLGVLPVIRLTGTLLRFNEEAVERALTKLRPRTRGRK